MIHELGGEAVAFYLGGGYTGQALEGLIERSGIESGQDLALAGIAAIDLGRGSLFGKPSPDCHPTHDRRRVAYNHSSSSGALP